MTTTINADTVVGGAVITGDISGELGLQAAGSTKLTVTAAGVSLATPLPVSSGGTGSSSTTFVNLATNVTGTLPIANGGTNQTTFTSPASGVAGAVYFDGTSFTSETTPKRAGYDYANYIWNVQVLQVNGSTSGYVRLQGAAAAGSTTYTLPSTDGTTGQMLSTNGSGTLSWATASGISTGKAIAMAMIFGG